MVRVHVSPLCYLDDLVMVGLMDLNRSIKKSPSHHIVPGGLAQLARALALHARGHRFESDILHKRSAVVIADEKSIPTESVGESDILH